MFARGQIQWKSAPRICQQSLSAADATGTSVVLISPGLLPDGGFRFDLQGLPGQEHVIQASTNLAD
jgi:hypothetical protein